LGRLLPSAAGSFPPSASAQSPAAPVLINCRLVIILDIIVTSWVQFLQICDFRWFDFAHHKFAI
jgi:hypothetical protein